MRHHQSGADGVLPEDLAAYVDGELDFQSRTRVESWLAQNPHVAAELESHRQLAGWLRDTQPANPGPAEWDRVFAGIQSGVRGKPPKRSSRRRSFLAIAGPITGIAAAVLLVIFVPRQTEVPTQPDAAPPVVINTEHANSTERSNKDDIVFVSNGDVHVEKMKPAIDGARPRFQEGPTPILIFPKAITPY